jgi:hypothetical protein
MNDNVKIWLRALRSGDFKQGTYSLKNLAGFCCLGVACEVSKVGKFATIRKGVATYVTSDKDNNYTHSTGSLPLSVREFYGIKNLTINLDSADTRKISARIVTLQTLNDYHQLTFLEIADMVEKYQDQLFTPME